MLAFSATTTTIVAEVEHIGSLPGQPPINFSMNSGYVIVDAMAGRALFYWLITTLTACRASRE
jgi:serine carboxypeptidase-like clade II